jgi:hypothetical protein
MYVGTSDSSIQAMHIQAVCVSEMNRNVPHLRAEPGPRPRFLVPLPRLVALRAARLYVHVASPVPGLLCALLTRGVCRA